MEMRDDAAVAQIAHEFMRLFERSFGLPQEMHWYNLGEDTQRDVILVVSAIRRGASSPEQGENDIENALLRYISSEVGLKIDFRTADNDALVQRWFHCFGTVVLELLDLDTVKVKWVRAQPEQSATQGDQV
jgi:hypothetical protein